MFALSRLFLLAALVLLGLIASPIPVSAADTWRVTTTGCSTSCVPGSRTSTVQAAAITRTITQSVRPLATSTSTVTAKPCTVTTVKAVARSVTVTAAARTNVITVTSTSVTLTVPTTTSLAPEYTSYADAISLDYRTWTQTSTIYSVIGPQPTLRDPSPEEPVQDPTRRRTIAMHVQQSRDMLAQRGTEAEKRNYNGKKVTCRPTVKVYSRLTLRPTSTITVRKTIRPTTTVTKTSFVPATFTRVPISQSVKTVIQRATITGTTVTYTSTPTAAIVTYTRLERVEVSEVDILNLNMRCAPGTDQYRFYGNNQNTRAGQTLIMLGGEYREEVTCCSAAAGQVGAIAYTWLPLQSQCQAYVLTDPEQCVRGEDPTFVFTEYGHDPGTTVLRQGLLQCATYWTSSTQ